MKYCCGWECDGRGERIPKSQIKRFRILVVRNSAQVELCLQMICGRIFSLSLLLDSQTLWWTSRSYLPHLATLSVNVATSFLSSELKQSRGRTLLPLLFCRNRTLLLWPSCSGANFYSSLTHFNRRSSHYSPCDEDTQFSKH